MIVRDSALTLIVSVIATLVVDIADAAPEFGKLVVLHRHGARTPMGVVDGALVCAYPYCQLTNQGKDMCRTLGRYISTTYNSTGLINLPENYNVSFMSSIGTDYSRVVVSGEAMVMGLYEGSPLQALPFVDFIPITDDVELVMWKSWPSYIIRNTYDTEVHVDDAWVRAFINESHLTELGQYFGIEALCASSPTDCVGFVQDSIACNVSSGSPVPSWIFERWEDYRVVVSKFLALMLGYDPSDSYDQNVGSFGYPFATSALKFLTNPNSGLLQLRHFAAHDWTLIAVYSALGIWTPPDAGNTTFVPRFAETLLLEQWTDSGVTYIKAKWGYPNQTSGSGYAYNFRVANMSCMSADGVVYGALSTAQSWCPVDDLWRFVNSTAPLSALGNCYATDDSLQAQNCDGDDAPPAGSRCLFYRQKCPAASCGQTDGAIADPARGYMCQSQQLGKDTPFMAATIVALVAPALLGGAITGFYFTNKFRSVFWSLTGTAPPSVDEKQPLAQEK
ncbi:histidine phosphatase, putative [Bodo saltans]|uniref:Histidine phosphatase, putative n=1 Tax=Bodo saltans TaxID=75058 RepID=A0A0S4JEA9_BODSA|nr:histidine phosphatase, putative [Bodo saltans]|eukprot:CUG88629.1 histidine phosphatase, putative [Bodo saltans]